jgi:thiamine biosynthesis lipoprotein
VFVGSWCRDSSDPAGAGKTRVSTAGDADAQVVRAMLHEHRFRAMNTNIAIWLASPEGDPRSVRSSLLWAESCFEGVEAEMSRFREDSALSRINRTAGSGPQPVPPRLWAVLTEAFQAAADTDGIFDPTLGRSMQRIGYDRSFERMTITGAAVTDTVQAAPSGWRRVRLNSDDRTITLPRDLALDAGGIAKGWTVDYVTLVLAALGPVLVDGGGDLRAIGRVEGERWLVAVEDPFEPARDRGRVRLEGGLTTSGVGGRCWHRGGRTLHHIIDPRTGTSAQTDLHGVTVHARDAMTADVAAKVALVLGSSRGGAYILSRGLSAFFVGANGAETIVGPFPLEGVDHHVSPCA